MIWNLLADAADGAAQNPASSYMLYIMFGVIIVLIIVYMMFSGKKNKQRQKEYLEQLEAIQPGHKVKTIGGICGVVAEVCDDNTVIIETGSELTGKSYVKMDKEMIAQTDAKGPTQLAREEAEAQKRAEKASKDPYAKPVLPEREEQKPEEVKVEQPKEESEPEAGASERKEN